MIKKYVMGSQKKKCYAVKDCTMYEEKFGIRVRHDCCSGSLRLLLVPSWFLVSSGFPAPGAWCLCSLVGVAPNLLIHEFIDNSAQQQIVLVSCPFLQ